MSHNRHCGIRNPGTTCWLACCVHALASIGPFRRALYRIEVNQDRPNETTEKVNAHRFIEKLQLTFHKLRKARRIDKNNKRQEDKRTTRSESIDSIDVTDLRKAAELLHRNIKAFGGINHEDCSEHFFHILHAIANYHTDYFQSTQTDAKQNPCNCFSIATTETNEAVFPCSNIILPVTTTSFYAALREVWFPKKKPDEKENTSSLKEKTNWLIEPLPDILTFTINRSDRNNIKRFSTFEIELEIAMDRHLKSRKDEATAFFESDDPEMEFNKNKAKWSEEMYILTAVIMHNGENTNAGHYNIFVLDINNYTGENTSDCKYVLYDDEQPQQEFSAKEALRKFEGREQALNSWSGVTDQRSSYCVSMLIYTKKNALLEESKNNNDDDTIFSKSMIAALKTMETENGNYAEKCKENGNQSEDDRENRDEADMNDVEMEVAATEPMRKRNTNTSVAVTRQIVNHRDSRMKFQLPTVERSVAHPSTVKYTAVYPLEYPMENRVPTVERSAVNPIDSSTENQHPTRTTKQIQQTGNFDIRLNPNDVRRRTQAQQRHGKKVTVLPKRDLQTFLSAHQPDIVQRPPLSFIQQYGTESGTAFLDRVTKKIQEIREPAHKVSRLESFISAEDSGYDDPHEEEEEEEDDKTKNAWTRMTEILKANTARMEIEQAMISEVREQLRSSSLDDEGEWPISITANSSEDRAIAITAYFNCRYSDYDTIYPHKKDVEKYSSGKDKYKNALDSLVKMKFRNAEKDGWAVRKQHLFIFRQSLQKYLPTKLREELSGSETVNDGKTALANVLEWIFEQKISDRSGWWKNALIFSLYCDGDLSPAPATQSIIEVLPISHENIQSYFTQLSDKDQSCPAIQEYLCCRYDVFLFTINAYAECINIWRLTFPLRDKYDAVARETENFKMESLLQCYNGMIRHLLPIFTGLKELLKGQTGSNQRRILGIDKTVLARMGAYTYALAVLRLLHASRRMAKEGNVELADGTMDEEDTAVEASKVAMLHLVTSVLSTTVQLSKLLEWWQKMMGENKDIDHAMTTMADALRRAAKLLRVNVDKSLEYNLPKPLETLDPNWRETALKSAESLLTRGSWISEKEALVAKSMGDNFHSLIETVRDCEAHSHYARGERDYEDEDIQLIHKSRRAHVPKQLIAENIQT